MPEESERYMAVNAAYMLFAGIVWRIAYTRTLCRRLFEQHPGGHAARQSTIETINHMRLHHLQKVLVHQLRTLA